MSPPSKRLASIATTLQFDKFWRWMQGHQNCILRAGTPETVLFDHEDFHWTLMSEDDNTCVIQVARGKELVGELIMFASEIAYVQAEPSEHEGEYLFECMTETADAREAAYHFVLAHEYDDGGHSKQDRWTH
jgi:hypothetical protein